MSLPEIKPRDRRAEATFIEALLSGSQTAFATMPASDREGIARLEAMGGRVEIVEREGHASDLACLRRYLFDPETPPIERELDGSLTFFSAPGEGREAVEIARRILREARAGVRFDEMAVLVRAPQHYIGLIEHALRRAKVPAWFGRGTRRPLTAGRAFLALLACAAEQLSASRFAEYLSFAQVPLASEQADTSWAASQDEAFGRIQPTEQELNQEPGIRTVELGTGDPESRVPRPGSESILAGTLRAPWRWEALIVVATIVSSGFTDLTLELRVLAFQPACPARCVTADDGGVDDQRLPAPRGTQCPCEDGL